jgi:hypothetical protein
MIIAPRGEAGLVRHQSGAWQKVYPPVGGDS